MAVKSIQLGQVWRKDDDNRDYLVTKVYSEVFSQYAVLRPAEVTAPDAPTVRVKVAKSTQGASLPVSPLPRKDHSRAPYVPGYGLSIRIRILLYSFRRDAERQSFEGARLPSRAANLTKSCKAWLEATPLQRLHSPKRSFSAAV